MCCECWSDEDEAEPTPEELAERRAREELRLAARMTPARTPVEQMARDIETNMARMNAALAEAIFSPRRETYAITGLDLTLAASHR